MRLAFFGRGSRPGAAQLLDGARALGWTVDAIRPQLLGPRDKPVPCDVAIFDGLRNDRDNLLARYLDAGIPSLIMEMARLRAGLEHDDQRAAWSGWGLYRNHLHYLSRRIGNRAVVHAPFERDPVPDDAPILLCGQKPFDTAHGQSDDAIALWVRDAIRRLRLAYNRPVIYRPHPHAFPTYPKCLGRLGEDGLSHPIDETLHEAMQDAAAVCVWNSTAAWDAIAVGVPVLYDAPREQCSAGEYAGRIGDPLTTLEAGVRDIALLRTAAQQWTVEQMAAGTPLAVEFLNAPMPDPKLVYIDPPASLPTTDGRTKRTRRSAARRPASTAQAG